MDLREFIEDIFEACYSLLSWRFLLCVLVGAGVAFLIWQSSLEMPLRCFAAGTVVVASIVIGFRWDSAHP